MVIDTFFNLNRTKFEELVNRNERRIVLFNAPKDDYTRSSFYNRYWFSRYSVIEENPLDEYRQANTQKPKLFRSAKFIQSSRVNCMRNAKIEQSLYYNKIGG